MTTKRLTTLAAAPVGAASSPHNAATSDATRGAAPISATVNETARLIGLSRTTIFRLLAAGEIRAVKVGSRTLVLWESVLAYMASRPAAAFQSAREGAR